MKVLEYSYFKKCNRLNFFKSIRPGSKVGDPVVTDLCALQYLPSGEINIKQGWHSSGFIPIPQRMKKVMGNEPLPALYKERLKIDANKFKHLQELKFVIPKEMHNFYETLPHK